MRVLHVSGPAQGGIARHMEQLRWGLVDWGVESELLPPQRTRPAAILKVREEIRRGKWDLVHCHGFQGGAVGRAAAVLAGVPTVFTIHNTLQTAWPLRLGAQLTEKMFREKTAYWVTVSAFLRNYAWRELGIPARRTEIIFNGVELPETLPPWQQQPVIGTVARLIPSKGIDIFLRAVQLLRPEVPGLKAVVIGSGPYEQQYRALSENLGLGKTVTFLGYREDVRDQLQKIAVFVLPTRSEGLGISVLEAMAMGVPVIATAVGGVPELIRHNQTGFLVRQDEYGAIARLVQRLLADREKGEALRGAAFALAAKEFNAKDMLERTYGLYRRVINA